MTGGGGSDRLARRMLKDAKRLKVPVAPDPDVAPISRVAWANAAGIVPDAWQAKALTSTARKLIWLACRQSGKSTTAALLATYEAVFNPGSLTLMVAPSLRQSSELFRKCLSILKGVEGVPIPSVVMESALRLELENGSRLIALPGSESTTRGYSAASLVIADECARIPDDLVAAVRPALATTNGRFVALSTPWGRRGFFYVEWASGVEWERSCITADECPRISREWLEDERRLLSPMKFEAEYQCVFHDNDSAAFSSELIEAALSADLQPLWSMAA